MEMAGEIQPLGSRVLGRVLEEESVTRSGIVTEVLLDGGEHLILESSDLLAVIRTPIAGAARAA